MKSILTFILATILLFPLQAQEKVYTVDNLPKVHLQNKMQYVCNPAGILSQAACDSIDSMLYALEQQTGIETVVAVVLQSEKKIVSTSATSYSTNGVLGRKAKIMDWSFCWSQINVASSFIPVMVWKECSPMRSAKGFKPNI